MPDPNNPNSPSPGDEGDQPSLPTLRETIETAYDNPDEGYEPSESGEAGQTDRVRDNLGRFAPKSEAKTGEQSTDPAPEDNLDEAQPRPPEPAPQGRSTQVPEHWSAELKADFSKLPPAGQAILLKRHNEMEADYTRKSQASAGAVTFTQALAPVFSDPVISGSLQQHGLGPVEAIQQWAGFQKRAMSQDVRDRINLLVELTQNMGLDPARLFATTSQPEPQLSQEDMNDPAIQFFANQQSRTQGELTALRGELQQMRQAEQQQRDAHKLQETRWNIDQFADEKDQSGRPLRPYFDAVVEDMVELFKADPTRDLQKTYDRCVWANEETRKHMLESQRHTLQGQNSVERARLAARGNTRGMTAPVSRPNASTNGSGSLRDVLAAAADEVGF